MPTALQYLRTVHNFGAGRFQSVDMPGKSASNSELARWLKQGMFHINGNPVQANDWIDMDDLKRAVLFPKNQRKRVTIV